MKYFNTSFWFYLFTVNV